MIGAPARQTPMLLAAAGLAGLSLVAIGQTALAPLLHHGPAAALGHGTHAGPGVASAAWLIGWGLMAAAMMLPGAVPLMRAVGGGVRVGTGNHLRGFTVAGFLGVWFALGLVALGALALTRGLSPAVVLAAAGIYQLSPTKRRALERCRAHGRLLPPGWASGRDPSGDALRAGISHGLASVACCGALMVATALVGMGEPVLMLVAGLAMTAEALTPRGPRITRPIGVCLLIAAVVAL